MRIYYAIVIQFVDQKAKVSLFNNLKAQFYYSISFDLSIVQILYFKRFYLDYFGRNS